VLARDEFSGVDGVSGVMGLARNSGTGDSDTGDSDAGCAPTGGAAGSGLAVLERTRTEVAARTEIALAELSDVDVEPIRAADSAESDARPVDTAYAWDAACACDLPPLPDDAIELPRDFTLP